MKTGRFARPSLRWWLWSLGFLLAIVAAGPSPVASPAQAAGVPPTVHLGQPQVAGYLVTVGGVTAPGAADASIIGLTWNWGDGQSTPSFFPGSHVYAHPGTYTVAVTSHQSDGLAVTSTTQVDVPPLAHRRVAGQLSRDASGSDGAASARSMTAVLRFAEAPPLIDPRLRMALSASARYIWVNWEPVLYFEDRLPQLFNPAEASLLVKAAGYGGGVPPLALMVEDVPLYHAVAASLAADWAYYLQTPVNIEYVPPLLFRARLQAGTFQLALGSR